MNKEELQKGNEYRRKIDQLRDIKHDVRPYLHERTEVKISMVKGLNSYLPNEETRREFTIYWDNPIIDVFLKTIDAEIELYENLLESLGKEEVIVDSQKDVEYPKEKKFNVDYFLSIGIVFHIIGWCSLLLVFCNLAEHNAGSVSSIISFGVATIFLFLYWLKH